MIKLKYDEYIKLFFLFFNCFEFYTTIYISLIFYFKKNKKKLD